MREEAQRGNLDAALRDVDRAYRETPAKEVGTAWKFRVLKAHILVMRGSPSAALQLLKEDLPNSLANSETALRRKMVSGLANESLQRFVEAEKDLREAEAMARAFQLVLLGDVEQSEGLLELDAKKFAEADASFLAVVSLARQQSKPSLEISALGSLGNSAMEQEHFDAAIDWYKKAQTIAKSQGMKASEAKTVGNLGWANFELGDFENALLLYQQSVDASDRSGLVADKVYWLTGVAKAQFALRNYPAAESVLLEALKLARKQDDKRILAEYLNDLCFIALEEGRVELARQYNEEALELGRAGLNQSGIRYSKFLNARVQLSSREFASAETEFRALIADDKSDQGLIWETQAQLAKLYEIQNLPARAEREFKQSLATIRKSRTSIRDEEFRLSFLSSSISFYSDYIDFLVSKERPGEALAVAELSRAQTLSEGLPNVQQISAPRSAKRGRQQLAQKLNAKLLYYWLGRQRSYLWFISPSKVSLISLPPGPEIDAAVKSYREALSDARDPLESGKAAGRKLYSLLIQPVEKLIGKNSRVIVLPDGSLNSLNFETLIVPGPKPRYWIEDETLLTANSLSLLSRSTNSVPPRAGKLLLVGAALTASPDFPALSQAGKEVSNVANRFPADRRHLLTGAQATATRFLASTPERFSYLHFATHGTASTTRPLESAVILSPDGYGYKLYARDIVQHHLSAYLVTISACNGAGMRTYAGEGLVGLSWAFLHAGAHNVIAGLWEVSDSSTPQLMDELYKGLAAGEDPATALRKAKLTLVHSDGIYRKPFYWAPFQLYAGS